MTSFEKTLRTVSRYPMRKSQVILDNRHALEGDITKFHYTLTINDLLFAFTASNSCPVHVAI